MTSHTFVSTFISLVIYHFTISLILSSQWTMIALNHYENEVKGTSDILILIKTEFDKLNDRISLLEVQNRNQDDDIDLLKMANSQIQDRIDSVNDDKSNEVIVDILIILNDHITTMMTLLVVLFLLIRSGTKNVHFDLFH